jgi:hypothetical protein
VQADHFERLAEDLDPLPDRVESREERLGQFVLMMPPEPAANSSIEVAAARMSPRSREPEPEAGDLTRFKFRCLPVYLDVDVRTAGKCG